MKPIHLLLSLIGVLALSIVPALPDARNGPRDQELTIPPGTVVNVRMIDGISSDYTVPGQLFLGSLENPIHVGTRMVVPRGADVYVKIVGVQSAGRIKGRSKLMLQLDNIVINRHHYPVASTIVEFRGASEGKKSARSTGIGAAVGGGVGALIGGGKGAAIGAGVGAGAGLAHGATHRGEAIRIGPESLLQFSLAVPVRIRG